MYPGAILLAVLWKYMCLKRLLPERREAVSVRASGFCGSHMLGNTAMRRCIIILVSPMSNNCKCSVPLPAKDPRAAQVPRGSEKRFDN